MKKGLIYAMVCLVLITVLITGLVAGCGTKTANPGVRSEIDTSTIYLDGSDPLTMDPALTGDASSAFYIEEVFGGLLTLVLVPKDVAKEKEGGIRYIDSETLMQMPKNWQQWISKWIVQGEKADAKVAMAPDLCEEIPEPIYNPDGTVSYVFKIRNNAKFHDGREVTAYDFQYSIDRACDSHLRPIPSTTAELYLSDIIEAEDMIRGRIENRVYREKDINEPFDITKVIGDIPGIEVLDKKTLKITIDAPKPYFLWKLTYPTAFVVDKLQVEADIQKYNWTRRPNGTGPFKLTSWERRQKIVLERNKDYHLGMPKTERFIVNLAGGGSPLMNFEENEVYITGIGKTTVGKVRGPEYSSYDPEVYDAELAKLYIETPSVDVYYIGFNSRMKPFDDMKVRQAFAMAIDKEKLAHEYLMDLVLPAHGILPPGVAGYRPDFKGLEFNPDKARQLLKESKYGGPEGLGRLILHVSGKGPSDKLGEKLTWEWKQNLGVEIEIEQTDFGTYIEDLKKGKYALFEMGWIADYPDAEDFLDLKFHGDRSVANNEVRYNNPEVNKLLEMARIESNPEKRVQLYQQAEKIIVEEAPWLPLFHGKNNAVIKPFIKGYYSPPMVIPILRFVEIVK
ncbi:MAG: hypothetical protein COV69_03405 [Parcubacteria group bacterium CG11_big_fil_rev_8_21_14_0_20_39_14]|nr:MAG: hypothetical protein COV69_03405 [Parcubacteria group bacterium CG11_big_fil_rev_8_21_14_0_20_39_14]PIS35805.1 MAG: hypothetical protein COT36_00450 [Parcubacteria group bacterium CG08_land_8_20_14_0_20_38_56]